MISLSSTPAMLAAMRTAKDITFSAYFLRPGGPVEQVLLDAIKRGAHVTVRLNGYFDNGPKRLLDWNKQAVRDLKRVHADAKMVHLSDKDGPMLHLKAAVCDSVAFLDDRNWTAGRDIVLRDTTPGEVSAIRAAAGYARAACKNIALTKAEALNRESDVIDSPRNRRVDIESETMTWHSPVYSAIKRHANDIHFRVLLSSQHLSGTTKKTIGYLETMHVDVRMVDSSDKIAIAGGERAWVGSANATATWPDPNESDWGYSTDTKRFVRALQSRFNVNWRASRPPAVRCYEVRPQA